MKALWVSSVLNHIVTVFVKLNAHLSWLNIIPPMPHKCYPYVNNEAIDQEGWHKHEEQEAKACYQPV